MNTSTRELLETLSEKLRLEVVGRMKEINKLVDSELSKANEEVVTINTTAGVVLGCLANAIDETIKTLKD